MNHGISKELSKEEKQMVEKYFPNFPLVVKNNKIKPP